MSSAIPVERLKNGMFYQMPTKEAERTALRIFELYDKAVNKEISLKELRNITKDVYSSLNIRKILNEEELQVYFQKLDKNNDGKIRETDFQKLMTEYFVNSSKSGALDISEQNRDLYSLCEKVDSKFDSKEEQIKHLVNEGERRFGRDFIEYQREECKKLFKKYETSGDGNLKFEEIDDMFEMIFKKTGIVGHQDKVDSRDFLRLHEMMDWEKTGDVCFEEFELFYLKGILGN